MGDELRITVLGCGSSGGVPRIGPAGPNWGACDPANPRNRRSRCALLAERIGPEGTTALLIDAGPDLRDQLIRAGNGLVDAVLFTHDHADHCHGIDDLRMVAINRRARVPAWMTVETEGFLRARFGYIFETPAGSSYPPILEVQRIDGPVRIEGAGGVLEANTFDVPHGDITALGVQIGPVAYTPDISAMTDEAWAVVRDIDCWILDALRYTPHISHPNVAQALAWITEAAPRIAYLTNLHIDLDHDTLASETPDHVIPAHDGLVLSYPL